jgi:hypothetical protein
MPRPSIPWSRSSSSGTLSNRSSIQLHTQDCIVRDGGTDSPFTHGKSIEQFCTYTPFRCLLSFALHSQAHQQLLSHSFLAISDLSFRISLSLTAKHPPLIPIKMQSIIALAGVVGLAAAAYAPSYDDNSRATTQDAVVPTPYAASSAFSPVETIPSYSSSVENAEFAPAPYSSSEAARFTSPLIWSTTQYIRTSAYTTYCSEATTLSFNTKTYTIAAPTTLTVTDCYNGCEIVKPLPTTTVEQTTPVVKTTQFETYCPTPTTVTFSAKTWTVTEATTLTIPQNTTSYSVFKTVIPIQPTYTAPINSTVRVSPTYESPVTPIPTYSSEVSPVQTSEAPVVPASTYEAPVAPVPTSTTYNAIIPPYPTGPAKSPVFQATATGTGSIYATAPLYTGAAVANRVGAGAIMAVAGFAALL